MFNLLPTMCSTIPACLVQEYQNNDLLLQKIYQNVIFTMTVNMLRPNPLAKIILIRFEKF